MATVDPRTWLEILPTTTCWELLGSNPVGRVAVVVDGAPEIYPVNFVVDAETIVFRTDAGSKLRGLDRSPAVSFEVDAIDVDEKSGWSVLVKGRSAEIVGDAVARAADLGLTFWSVGEKAHWVRITPTEVSGRCIHPPHAPASGSSPGAPRPGGGRRGGG